MSPLNSLFGCVMVEQCIAFSNIVLEKKMNSMFEKNMVLMVGPKNIKIELLKFYNISRPFGLYSTAMKIDKYSFHVC